MGINESKKVFWIRVEAIDPDDACSEAYKKVHLIITKKNKSTKFKTASKIVKEKLRILKIEVSQ